MKRLLGTIGITYLSVLAIAFYLGTTVAIIIGIASALTLIITLMIKRTGVTEIFSVVLLVVMISCAANIAYTVFYYQPIVDKYDNYSGEVVAVLRDEPYKSYSMYCYEFRTVSIGDEDTKIGFTLMCENPLEIEPYDIAYIDDITLVSTENAKSLSRRNFFVGSYPYGDMPDICVTATNDKPAYYYAIKLLQTIRSNLERVLSDDAFSLCSALLIGDKYALSSDIRLDFNRSGVTHLIVVSGMHFSILASGFLLCARKFYSLRKLFVALTIIFILLYMAVTGYSPSVMRAGIMLVIYSSGFLVSRESYNLNSLGIAALAVTLFNPYSVGDLGLIFSFATTASILVFAPKIRSKFCIRIKTDKTDHPLLLTIKRLINKLTDFILSVLSMNISAFVASLPISIIFFGGVSTMSVVSTFILFLPIQILLILALLICVFSFMPMFYSVVMFLSSLAQWFTELTFSVVEYISSLEFSYVYVTYDFVYLWVMISLVLMALYFIYKGKVRLRLVSFMIAFLFIVGILSATVLSDNYTTLDVYNVDSGLSVVYRDHDISAVLAFDNTKKNSLNTISKLERKITRINFCSSVCDTTNSANSLDLLSESFAISDVLLYDTKRDIYLPDTVGNIITPADIHEVALSDSAVVTYYKVADVYITYLDSVNGSVLILPDIIDASNIPAQYRDADTIIMRNCPDNFECLSCDTLIISNSADMSYDIMQYAHSICEKVILTAEGDISMIMEV